LIATAAELRAMSDGQSGSGAEGDDDIISRRVQCYPSSSNDGPCDIACCCARFVVSTMVTSLGQAFYHPLFSAER